MKWVTWAAAAVAAVNAQSEMVAPITTETNIVEYFTENVILGTPGTQINFRLDFNPSLISIIDSASQSVGLAARASKTFEIDNVTGYAKDILTFPNAQFKASFQLGAINTLSFLQLAQKGVVWCDGSVFFESEVIPDACLSSRYARATCAKSECYYAALINGTPALAKSDPHMNIVDCKQTFFIFVNNNQKVEVCANETTFNPALNDATILQRQNEQILYFQDRNDNGPVGALFAIAIILALAIWISNMPEFIESDDTADLVKNQATAFATADIAVSVGSASLFALTDAGSAYVPPETGLAIGYEYLWLGIYIGSMLFSAVIASVSAILRPHVDSLKINGRHFGLITRASIETLLLSTLHFHLPQTMGTSLRRTIGMFVGMTQTAIIARDVPHRIKNVSLHMALAIMCWILLTLTNIIFLMILPVVYQSAGFRNSVSIPVSAVIVVAIAVFASSYSDRNTR